MDDWSVYHNGKGEIHCGTNVRRTGTPRDPLVDATLLRVHLSSPHHPDPAMIPLLLPLLLAASAPLQGPEISPAALLDLSRDPMRRRLDYEGRLERERLYQGAIDRIGRLPAPPDADPSPEAELVRAARDRLAHPELAAEIEETYTRVGNPQGIVRRGRRAGPPHLDPRYRYAWEILLVRSRFVLGADGYGGEALRGLSLIGDDASLPLIMRFFKGRGDAYRSDRDEAAALFEGYDLYLTCLAGFVSEAGLDALLDCLRAAEEAAEEAVAVAVAVVNHGPQPVPPAEVVRAQLRPQRPTERSAAWEAVIAAYERKPSNVAKARTLHEMLNRIP